MARSNYRLRDLARLYYATGLLVRQQNERLVYGGPEEYDDVSDENRDITEKVLPTVEQALDEDLVRELDDMMDRGWHSRFPTVGPFMPPVPAAPVGPPFFGTMPAFPPNPFFAPFGAPEVSHRSRPVRTRPRRRPSASRVDHAVDDFRERVQTEIERTRERAAALPPSQLEELIAQLRSDLVDATQTPPPGHEASDRGSPVAERTAEATPEGTTGTGRTRRTNP